MPTASSTSAAAPNLISSSVNGPAEQQTDLAGRLAGAEQHDEEARERRMVRLAERRVMAEVLVR